MISGILLNSSATLNDFFELSALEYTPGSDFVVNVRLTQRERPDELRYIPEAGATLNIILPGKNGTDLTVAMAEFPEDRSMWTGNVTGAQSENLASGNITIELTESTLKKGVIQNGLQLIVIGDC